MALAHCVFGIGNLNGFKCIVTQSSNFIIIFFIQPMTPKANEARTGKNECLKILGIIYCKSRSLLLHGRWLLYVRQKSNLYVFNALI